MFAKLEPMADLTKKDIQQLLDKQTKELTKELKGYTDKKTDIILHSVAKGFKNEHEYNNGRFNQLNESLGNMKEKVIEHDRKWQGRRGVV